jgi:hypothetical protein
VSVQRVGKWVGVNGKWFLADDVVAVLELPHEDAYPRCQVMIGLMCSTEIINLEAKSSDVWQAVAGPIKDDAVSIGASLGKPQEIP